MQANFAIIFFMENYNKWRKRLGKKIKEQRLKKGLTQEQMADSELYSIGVRPYQRYEAGTISPTTKTLYRIAKRIGVSVKDLIPDD